MAAFSDAGKSPLPNVSFLVHTRELTQDQARVATQVALGKSIKQTAAELDARPTTARTKPDDAVLKIGTCKQSEMERELPSLPDTRAEETGWAEAH